MNPETTWLEVLQCLELRNYIDAMVHLEKLEEFAIQGGQLPEYLSRRVIRAVIVSIRPIAF